MGIVESYIDQICKDIEGHIRRADPAHMDITFARKCRPLKDHGKPVDGFVIGDELTITIEIRKEKV